MACCNSCENGKPCETTCKSGPIGRTFLPDDGISTGVPGYPAPGMQDIGLDFKKFQPVISRAQSMFRAESENKGMAQQIDKLRAANRILKRKEMECRDELDAIEDSIDEDLMSGRRGGGVRWKRKLNAAEIKVAKANQQRRKKGLKPVKKARGSSRSSRLKSSPKRVNRFARRGIRMRGDDAPQQFDTLPPGYKWYANVSSSYERGADQSDTFPPNSFYTPDDPENVWDGSNWSKAGPQLGQRIEGIPGTKFEGCFYVWSQDGSEDGRWACPESSNLSGSDDVGLLHLIPMYFMHKKMKKQKAAQKRALRAANRPIIRKSRNENDQDRDDQDDQDDQDQDEMQGCCLGDMMGGPCVYDLHKKVSAMRGYSVQSPVTSFDWKAALNWKNITWRKEDNGKSLRAIYHFQTPEGPIEANVKIRFDAIIKLLAKMARKNGIAIDSHLHSLAGAIAKDKAVQNLAAQGFAKGVKSTGLEKTKEYRIAKGLVQNQNHPKVKKALIRVQQRASAGDPNAMAMNSLIERAKKEPFISRIIRVKKDSGNSLYEKGFYINS